MIGGLPITVDEIIYAAVLALFVTATIKCVIRTKNAFANAKKLMESDKNFDIGNMMNKCYAMFPIDEIMFKGTKFTRGMKIKITTKNNADFEGEFIGGNDRNMLCIKTKKYIIAHELKNIYEIKNIGQ